MSKSESVKHSGLPAWIHELFNDFLDHQENIGLVLHLSMNGISMLRGRHQAMKVLSELGEDPTISSEDIERAEKERDLAQKELDNDFPLLHEQATVAAWSSLEALIRRFVALWLSNRPEAWQTEQIGRLKVRVGDYESLSQIDRCLWITDLLDQEVAGPLRNGVSRFECLLQPFGLGGSLPEDIQKQLFELSQIRHVIVHRRSKADKRLLDACSWLPFKLGDRVRVTHGMWTAYDGAVGAYVLELIQRIRVKYGIRRYVYPTSPQG
ncbi:MAG: hypothetical protein ACLP7O_14760 [Terracidiphilus sp.]